MATFAERLRQERKKAGIMQEDAAHDLKIRYSTYRRYEAGGTEPTVSTFVRIADYFHVSLDYLAGRTEN